MANRMKKNKSVRSKSKQNSRAKTKSCQKDVAGNLPNPTADTGDSAIGIMQNNRAAESTSTQATSLPYPVSQAQADSAPNGGIESCDLNQKQVQPSLDGSNVLAPENPLSSSPQEMEVEDIPILENVEKNKENVSCPRTTSPSEICPVKDNQLLTKENTDHGQNQQIGRVNGLGCTEIDTALNGTSSLSNELINNNEQKTRKLSPILQQHYKNLRPKTPTAPIPTVTEMFSPNTVKEFRSTVRALFPNGPPPPKPVIPVKRHKKGDLPYIVGCTTRKRVPEKRSLNCFKGDKYGITEQTNSFDNEECPTKRKRGKRNNYANWSKSRFNPKSEEIAARLKINESVDNMLRKSPSKETVSYMSKPYTPRPHAAFSPLPSTSKDSETIMKNEKHFSESLKYDSENFDVCENFDVRDDDELPDIKWDSKNNNNKKRRHHSLLQIKDIELINNQEKSLVKSEDLNNNNNDIGEDVDFCEIQFDKYLPKKEYPIPTVTTSVTASSSPIIIDEIDDEFDNVNKATEPKRVLGEISKIIDTQEITDEYSSLTYEDLYSVPKTTEIVDVDELFRDIENFQQRKRKRYQDVITIVDPATSVPTDYKKPDVSSIPTQVWHNDKPNADNPSSTTEPLVDDRAMATTMETAEVIEIPDSVTSSTDLSNLPSTSGTNIKKSYSSNSDVVFVSETIDPEATGKKNDIETVVTGFFSEHNLNNTSNMPRRTTPTSTNTDVTNGLEMLFAFLSDTSSRFSQPKRRKKNKRQLPKKPREQPQQEPGTVNNENTAPCTNEQTKTPATNGERKLGDCPICMENLSRNAIASTTCGHVFCLDCIKKCLRTSGKKCPTCRKTLKGAGYHQVFL